MLLSPRKFLFALSKIAPTTGELCVLDIIDQDDQLLVEFYIYKNTKKWKMISGDPSLQRWSKLHQYCFSKWSPLFQSLEEALSAMADCLDSENFGSYSAWAYYYLPGDPADDRCPDESGKLVSTTRFKFQLAKDHVAP